jgi:hypothetical protein
MSKSYGIEFLRNRGRAPGGKIPALEHFNGLSRASVQHLTGEDPLKHPERLPEIYQELGRKLDVDLNWGAGFPAAHTEMHDWSKGPSMRQSREGHPVVQWGVFHVLAQEDGRHFLDIPIPKDVDEALAFDPLEHFPKTVEDYRQQFAREYSEMLATTGDVAYPIPHHYTTCFHWPLATFGFEMLCEAGMEEDDFHDQIARFAEISTRITTAWSQVEGIEGFILHDDLAMTAGLIFRPDWYREHVISFYPQIFKPLKDKGIPIIFTSDGNCTDLVDDIFDAGADGFNFEDLVDLEMMAEKHGDKILVGNFNNATIAAGPDAAIREHIQRCYDIGRHVPGYVANVGGGLTHQIPIPHLESYLDIRRQLSRPSG